MRIMRKYFDKSLQPTEVSNFNSYDATELRIYYINLLLACSYLNIKTIYGNRVVIEKKGFFPWLMGFKNISY